MAAWGCFCRDSLHRCKMSNFTAFKLSWVLGKKATGLCDHILSGSWIFEDAQWRTSNINKGKAEQQMQQLCHPLCGRFVWNSSMTSQCTCINRQHLQTNDGSSQGQNTKTALNSIRCAVRHFTPTDKDHRWTLVGVYNTNSQPPTMQSGDSFLGVSTTTRTLTVTSTAHIGVGQVSRRSFTPWPWWWQWSMFCFTPLDHATTHMIISRTSGEGSPLISNTNVQF